MSVKASSRAIGLAIVTLNVSAPALAQTSSPAPAGSPAAGNDTGVQEIIVTAQRRKEPLQSVPVAVTAIDSEGLAKAGIRDITTLGTLTPGLTVGQSGSDSRPAMRGVNTDNSRQAQADATVAFFMDGVYQSSNQQALQGFVDLARVEVQRGPQGTLYGRNSFGGNISLVSNLPTDRLEGSVFGELGSFSRRKFNGVINVPISDSLAFRAAGQYEKSDGYVKNITPGGTRAGDIDDAYGRLSLLWRLDDRTDVILRGSRWKGGGSGAGAYEYKVEGVQVNSLTVPPGGTINSNQDIRGTIVVPVNPRARTGDIATLPAAGVPVPTDPWTIDSDTPSTRSVGNTAGTIEVNRSLGFGNLKFIGSYSDFNAKRTSDGDFTSYNVRFNLQESKNKTNTGEVQLASESNSALQYVAGVYYLSTTASEYFQQYRYTFSAFTDNVLTNFDTKSAAAYGQATYAILPALRLTGGLRYTDDKKSSSGTDYANLTAGQPTLSPDVSKSFNKVTWRGAVDYQLEQDKLLYFSVSTGFRSGGFNTFVSLPNLLTFQPETVTAYEVGAKTRWFRNTLQVNLSAFYNSYKAIQINGYDANTNLVYTQNVGGRRARGIEAEVQFRPTPQLQTYLTAAYLDATYRSGAAAFDPISGDSISIAGNQSGFSPKWRVNAGVSYDFKIGDGKLTPRLSSSYVSRYYLTDFNAFIEKQDSYAKTDFRVTYLAPGDRLSVEGFVTNIENTASKSGGEFGGRGAYFIAYAPPRQYGLNVSYKF
jgi:iron complex outermembrane receptor protein